MYWETLSTGWPDFRAPMLARSHPNEVLVIKWIKALTNYLEQFNKCWFSSRGWNLRELTSCCDVQCSTNPLCCRSAINRQNRSSEKILFFRKTFPWRMSTRCEREMWLIQSTILALTCKTDEPPPLPASNIERIPWMNQESGVWWTRFFWWMDER